MSSDATAWVMAHPSFEEPNILVQQNQASDFPAILAGSAPRVKLASEDKFVYIKQLAIRTKVQSNAAGGSSLPSVSITTGLASAPTYLQQVVALYDHHQTAAMANWGINIVDAQSLGMQQGHYQALRGKAIFGEQPANGEGILNATGITQTTLPADTFGNARFSTYDNGQMAFYLLSLVQQIKARTYQGSRPQKFTILGPQQDVMPWMYQAIVQLTSYQRAGAGSASVGKTVKEILESNGDSVEFGYDDTLIGAGASGTDAIIIVMPELDVPSRPNWNTNAAAKITPNMTDNTLLYTDVSAPIEIPTPVPGGGIHILSEMRATSGWAVRPEAVTVLSGAN